MQQGKKLRNVGKQTANLKKTWRQLRLVQRPSPLQPGELPRRAQVVGVHPFPFPSLLKNIRFLKDRFIFLGAVQCRCTLCSS